jgi:hypothetical protein
MVGVCYILHDSIIVYIVVYPTVLAPIERGSYPTTPENHQDKGDQFERS